MISLFSMRVCVFVSMFVCSEILFLFINVRPACLLSHTADQRNTTVNTGVHMCVFVCLVVFFFSFLITQNFLFHVID